MPQTNNNQGFFRHQLLPRAGRRESWLSVCALAFGAAACSGSNSASPNANPDAAGDAGGGAAGVSSRSGAGGRTGIGGHGGVSGRAGAGGSTTTDGRADGGGRAGAGESAGPGGPAGAAGVAGSEASAGTGAGFAGGGASAGPGGGSDVGGSSVGGSSVGGSSVGGSSVGGSSVGGSNAGSGGDTSVVAGAGAAGAGACESVLLPKVEFAAPYIALANHVGTLILRGAQFDAPGTGLTVRIGSTRIGPLARDSDSQVTLQTPALPEGHYPVGIENGTCLGPSNAELVVLAPPALNYQAISAPSTRERLVYDAERQTLYAVNRTDQEIERYHYAAGAWTALQPYVLPDLTDIALAPNGRSLIASTRGGISEIQLGKALFVAEARALNPDTFCGGFFDNVTMANDGSVFVIFNLAQCSGFSASYLYDMRTHGLAANPYFEGYFYNGSAGGSLDGSRIYAGSNGVSPAERVKIFNTLTHQITDAAPSYNLYRVSVSANASRVILQDADVYSRALTLTGRLPTGGIALASLDSSRAFVYRDDGDAPRIVVHDLNGSLEAGGLYPVLRTVALPNSPNVMGAAASMTLTSVADDSVVFVSGNRNILVVPVD